MNENFIRGFVDEIEKTARRREAALAGALNLGPLAGLFAEKGKRLRTAIGATLGSIGGGALGSLPFLLPTKTLAGLMGKTMLGTLGTFAGGGLGAHLAHGRDSAKVRALRKLMKKLKKVKK